MQPKTKLQKRVYALSQKMPPLSEAQREWALKNVFKPSGYIRKKSIWCHECGSTFKSENTMHDTILGEKECPVCGECIELQHGSYSSYVWRDYYSIITVSDGFQVVRHFTVEKSFRVGKPAETLIVEVIQNWITPDGKVTNVARAVHWGIYYDMWDYTSPMEIRRPSSVGGKYNPHTDYVYPRKRFIKELRRNGFRGGLHGIRPKTLFVLLLTDPKAETLLKVKQYSMLKYFISTWRNIDDYWPSIKICIRNNYIVRTAETWVDYLEMLKRDGRDLRNAHYVCPANIKEAHDRLVRKFNRIRENEKKEKLRKVAASYGEFISPFQNFCFKNGDITITPFLTLEQFKEEGTILNHCIDSSSYYNRRESLCFSVRVDNVVTATIEFSLIDGKVLQLRCKDNEDLPPTLQKRVLELFNPHSREIMRVVSGIIKQPA